MNPLSRWFGPKFADEQLMVIAKRVLARDPLITDPTSVSVTSVKGVVTLSGVVHRDEDRVRIEGAVRSALRDVGIKYDRLANELKVTAGSLVI
jgi:hypothetical protein